MLLKVSTTKINIALPSRDRPKNTKYYKQLLKILIKNEET